LQLKRVKHVIAIAGCKRRIAATRGALEAVGSTFSPRDRATEKRHLK